MTTADRSAAHARRAELDPGFGTPPTYERRRRAKYRTLDAEHSLAHTLAACNLDGIRWQLASLTRDDKISSSSSPADAYHWHRQARAGLICRTLGHLATWIASGSAPAPRIAHDAARELANQTQEPTRFAQQAQTLAGMIGRNIAGRSPRSRYLAGLRRQQLGAAFAALAAVAAAYEVARHVERQLRSELNWLSARSRQMDVQGDCAHESGDPAAADSFYMEASRLDRTACDVAQRLDYFAATVDRTTAARQHPGA